MSLSSKKRVKKTSASKSKKETVKSIKAAFEAYKKVVEEFAKQVENIGYQVVASIPAVKEVNGMQMPAGVTVAELLSMAKMATAHDRALCIGSSPNGQELTIVSVLKRPAVPLAIRHDPVWIERPWQMV